MSESWRWEEGEGYFEFWLDDFLFLSVLLLCVVRPFPKTDIEKDPAIWMNVERRLMVVSDIRDE